MPCQPIWRGAHPLKRSACRLITRNVGEVYAQLARDLRDATHRTPGFQHALHNARLVEAVMHSAERGVRQKLHHQDARAD